MSWNYRIVKYANGSGYGLHEVHYDKDGEAIRMGNRLAGFVGDDPEEVRGELMVAKMDAYKRPVFDEPPEWATRYPGESEKEVRGIEFQQPILPAVATDRERRLAERYTRVSRTVVEGVEDATVPWLKVEQQAFRLMPEYCDTQQEAGFICWQAAVALAKIVDRGSSEEHKQGA